MIEVTQVTPLGFLGTFLYFDPISAKPVGTGIALVSGEFGSFALKARPLLGRREMESVYWRDSVMD